MKCIIIEAITLTARNPSVIKSGNSGINSGGPALMYETAMIMDIGPELPPTGKFIVKELSA